MDEYTIIVTFEDLQHYKRLDLFLVAKFSQLSRSVIKNLFSKGLVKADVELELSRMPQCGTELTIKVPPSPPCKAEPENIPLDILYEDENLIIINKAAGMVTHPAPGNYQGTLINAILHHCPDLAGVGDERRPGIVHRLDKGTSGVMVVAKNQKCHQGLVELFSAHNIKRRYQAIVVGTKIDPLGKIETLFRRHPSNRLKMTSKGQKGKKAITHYRVLQYFNKVSHLELELYTGRTHQIRVHLSEVLRTPILGDELYGNPKEQLKLLGGGIKEILKDYQYPLLHAKLLGFVHPITKKEILFDVPPPVIFQQTLEKAANDNI